MPRTDLKITITSAADTVTVTMIGEAHFDFDAADKYIREVMRHKPRRVVVDATELSFISSVGMCFLINLRRAAKEAGGGLTLAGLQPMVQKALENAHILHLFDLGAAESTTHA